MDPIIFAQFKNPYRDEPLLSRLNVDVKTSDKRLLCSIHVDRGFLQTVVSLLIKRLADECKQREYTYNNQRDLEILALRLLGSPVRMADGTDPREGTEGSDTGGNETGDRPPAGTSDLPTGGAVSETPTKRKGKRRKTEGHEAPIN